MANPFQFQRPLAPSDMIDRTEETRYILDALDSATMIRLDAPRRYGKTSLMLRAFRELDLQGDVGILIDLKGAMALTDIIGRIGRAYGQLSNPASKKVKSALQAIEAEFGITVFGQSAKLKAGVRRTTLSEEEALFALLEIPNKIAAKGERRVLVCFDEFQDVLQVPKADDKLRSAIQHHDSFVSYLFAGSQPRLMNELFSDRRRAFWDQADPLALAPLRAGDVIEYVNRRFEETGKDAGHAVVSLTTTAHGHPQRVMLLANKLWGFTAPGDTAQERHWERALEAAMLQEHPTFEAQWSAIDPTGPARRVLRAVALNSGRPRTKVALEDAGLNKGSVPKAAEQLVGQCMLRKVGEGRYQFVDPLFEIYVRRLADGRA